MYIYQVLLFGKR